MFQSWSDNNTALTRTITLNADTTLTATYAIVTANLVLLSNPTGLSLDVDGTANITPITLVLQVGTHTITARSQQVQGVSYAFQKWSDGDTSPTKTIDLQTATTLTATFITVTHSLTITSNITGVPFSIVGVPFTLTTPFGPLQEPEYQYTIIMPAIANVAGSNYSFQGWSDGVTTSTRTINFVTDMSLQANYQLIIQTSVLTVQSNIPATFTLDGMLEATPFTGTLNDGSHTIAVPGSVQSGGVTYNFQQWEDGSTNTTRVINLTANITIQATYGILGWNLQISSTGLSPLQFTLNGTPLSTPYNANLAPGTYTLSVPGSVTILPTTTSPPATSGFGTFDFKNWSDGILTPTRTLTLNQNTVLTAVFTELLSWNPNVPYTPVRVRIENVIGPLASSLGGATLSGGWPWPLNPTGFDPNYDIKRNFRPPGIITGLNPQYPTGPTFVEIDNVVCEAYQHSSTVAPTTEDCASVYTTINGGGPLPPNPSPLGCETASSWGDTTVNLLSLGLPVTAQCNTTTKVACLHVIHIEIDRDWKASGRLGPTNNCDWLQFAQLPPINYLSKPIDIQGFVYWDSSHITEAYHSFSGWEIHPLTAWRVH